MCVPSRRDGAGSQKLKAGDEFTGRLRKQQQIKAHSQLSPQCVCVCKYSIYIRSSLMDSEISETIRED